MSRLALKSKTNKMEKTNKLKNNQTGNCNFPNMRGFFLFFCFVLQVSSDWHDCNHLPQPSVKFAKHIYLEFFYLKKKKWARKQNCSLCVLQRMNEESFQTELPLLPGMSNHQVMTQSRENNTSGVIVGYFSEFAVAASTWEVRYQADRRTNSTSTDRAQSVSTLVPSQTC